MAFWRDLWEGVKDLFGGGSEKDEDKDKNEDEDEESKEEPPDYGDDYEEMQEMDLGEDEY